jgi:hypothetical protein
VTTLGGFIGNARVFGVPGADGPGEPIAPESDTEICDREPKSGGAGLLDDILRLDPGKSIFAWLAILAAFAA